METQGKFYNYKITNLINGKIYIGKCEIADRRWKQHIAAAKRPESKEKKLYISRAMRKYGVENFSFEIIAEYNSEKEALAGESYYIKLYNSNDRTIGYNLTEGGEGTSGYRHTAESKALMSERLKGKFVGENNPFYGKHHTTETKELLRQKLIALDFNAERNPFYGKHHTKETIKKANETKVRNNSAGCDPKFEEPLVSEIRNKFHIKNYFLETLAEEYKCCISTISRICNYKIPYDYGKPSDFIEYNTPREKLPNEILYEIRFKYWNYDYTPEELSNIYNRAPATIIKIVTFQDTYKDDNKSDFNVVFERKILDKKLRDEIQIKLFSGKYSQKELCKEYNLSVSTINRITKYPNKFIDQNFTKQILDTIEPNKKKDVHYVGGNGQKIFEDDKIQIRKEYADGVSYKDIADKFKVHWATIRDVCTYQRAYAKDAPEGYVLNLAIKSERLPKAVADEIRTKFATGKYTRKQLGIEYNIAVGLVSNITNFKRGYAKDKI